MKKYFILAIIFLVLLMPTFAVFAVGSGDGTGDATQTTPAQSSAAGGQAGGCGGIVGCPTGPGGTYSLDDFFGMLGRIYDFIVLTIATPLAVIAIIIGAILMMISAGNPNLMGTGKKIFYAAIIGLVLVFGSYMIINFVLTAIGAKGLGG